MKVVLVGTGAYSIPPTGYGAIERILADYAQALVRAGDPVRVVNEPRGGGSLAEYRFALRLPGLLKREDFDILHVSTPVVANRLSAAGFPFVYTSHSRHWFWRPNWRHRWGFWLERRAVRRATAVVALTRDLEFAIRSTWPPGFQRPLRVIPYGIQLDQYRADWDRRSGRRVLGVGVVSPLKRWEIAAAAAKDLGVSLRIAGPISDPDYASRVRGIGDHVHLMGEVVEPRLRELYAESDVLVHPSRVEVLPRAVLEALASSLPVIGSSSVGAVFSDPREGRVAPPGASDSELVGFFRRALQELLSSSDLRRQTGAIGRALAERCYSWEAVVAAHRALYREIQGLVP